MSIAREFVAHLCLVTCLTAYLVLTLADELRAHLVEYLHDHLVKQMMPLDIQIGFLWLYAIVLYQFTLQFQITLLGVGILLLEHRYAAAHLVAQVGDGCERLAEAKAAKFNDTVEVGNGELGIYRTAIVPDAPHEERENGGAILPHELVEVEQLMVVERHRNAHIMQRRRIALHVLYRVGKGMENVGIVYHSLARLRGSIYEVVVIGIDTRNHVAPHLVLKNPHNGRLLASLQRVVRGQQHLEVTGVVLKLRQHRAPKEHIIVTLHIRHDAATRSLRAQPVGCLKVFRRYVVF